jgi:DNA helicase-2/ATP-dependent DNA helicase PcrA
MDAVLDGLNEAQLSAVTHDDGPLLIIAGAGTGKTTTLAHRVAFHVAEGTDPGRILLLTFTRRAAQEMLSRVDSIMRRLRAGGAARADATSVAAQPGGSLAGSRVWGGTFHATAARLLRMHGRSIDLDPAFTIHDRADSEDLMDLVRTELGLARTDRRFPQKSTCLDIYCRCVDTRMRLEEVLQRHFPWVKEHADDLKRLFKGYVDAKGAQGVLDYDDLLLFWHAMLSDEPTAARIREHFDKVLVDEYQDTNVLQAEILKGLSPDGAGLTAVGDDAQAIYSFRAATVRNILDFPEHFPGATVITLDRNYRSTQPILAAANRVIALSPERYEKELWTGREGGEKPALVTCQDEEEQAEYVIERVLEHREGGLELKRQAVLFRASHHSLLLEMELARRNIPYHKYGGLKFLEQAHVRDLAAFLRLAENPRDRMAGQRVLMLLPGIGPKTARQAMDALVEAGGDVMAAWGGGERGSGECGRGERRPSPLFVPPPASRELWPGFVRLMGYLSSAPVEAVAPQIQAVRTFYQPLAERRYADVDARMRDLEELEGISARVGDRTRFLAELTLDPPAWTGDFAGAPVLDEDFLILSTMHSAKGLEWDAVYVIHAADGNIPSDLSTGRPEEIEEERRLFYVALSRAKDWLYVCCPLRYYTVPRNLASDRYGYAQVTRFVCADDVREAFEHVQARGTTEMDAAAVGASEVTSELIRERIKSFWE